MDLKDSNLYSVELKRRLKFPFRKYIGEIFRQNIITINISNIWNIM